ncbi:MAG: SDR family NAD(P)-dependent oxidoreductase [Alphaproteobacteria bacterium]|nr:SDR family NAD(P)-dependent oxidoreductase [Alphaproteobacteria bacterium]
MGVLDGKVILVTGGGRGIGREHALLAAREGAKVVVNDLGGSIAGNDAGEAGPAQEVADEIKAAGGDAAANSDSVAEMSGAKHMFEQAMDSFGGLNGVIAPAGILRDTMFHKMSEEDWDAVINVHLKGSFNVCRATINHFRNQEDGAYVLFTSTSGLIGNIGQTNYAAAKMGIVGLSRVIAMENERKNVRSNILSPSAWTRMIGTIPIKDEATAKRIELTKARMRPDQIAPLGVALVADEAKDLTGQIFSIRGNEVYIWNQPRPTRGIANTEGWTPSTMLSNAFPAFRANTTDLGNARTVFTSDPL